MQKTFKKSSLERGRERGSALGFAMAAVEAFRAII